MDHARGARRGQSGLSRRYFICMRRSVCVCVWCAVVVVMRAAPRLHRAAPASPPAGGASCRPPPSPRRACLGNVRAVSTGRRGRTRVAWGRLPSTCEATTVYLSLPLLLAIGLLLRSKDSLSILPPSPFFSPSASSYSSAHHRRRFLGRPGAADAAPPPPPPPAFPVAPDECAGGNNPRRRVMAPQPTSTPAQSHLTIGEAAQPVVRRPTATLGHSPAPRKPGLSLQL